MRPWHAYHACVHKPMGRIPPRQPPSPSPTTGPSTPPGDLARPDTPSVYAIGPGVLGKCPICVLIVIWWLSMSPSPDEYHVFHDDSHPGWIRSCTHMCIHIIYNIYIYIYVYIINIYMNVTWCDIDVMMIMMGYIALFTYLYIAYCLLPVLFHLSLYVSLYMYIHRLC